MRVGRAGAGTAKEEENAGLDAWDVISAIPIDNPDSGLDDAVRASTHSPESGALARCMAYSCSPY